MRLSILTAAGVISAALMTSTAFAGEVSLYTWRIQEQPLWDALNASGALGDTTVKVNLITSDDYDAKIRIALQSPGVDLFQGRAGAAWLSSFIDAGIIKETGTDLANIAPGTLDAARGPDGKLYGVPFAVQMEGFLYNTAVFADNGIEIPKTADELKAAADKLKAAGIVPINFGGRSGWWLNQVVGEAMTAGLVSDDTAAKLISGEACFTDPEYVTTLQAVADWKAAGYINDSAMADDYGAMRTAVALGESAMMLDGGWSMGPTSPMYEINPDLKLGFFPVPGPNGKVYAFGDGTYLVNANSANAAEAQKVLDFTATKEFAELFVKHVGELPAFGGAYTVEDPLLKSVADAVANNASSQTPFFAYALNSGQPSYGSLEQAAYEKILGGTGTAEEAAKDIQAGLNSWNYAGAAKCAL
ncbi:MAG: extracellular solute-binding protein [Hyphomicrobiales bacterium]|nr:MAG: extracellular solute-binding protein [Hyphomicrobiales bacterium]